MIVTEVREGGAMGMSGQRPERLLKILPGQRTALTSKNVSHATVVKTGSRLTSLRIHSPLS